MSNYTQTVIDGIIREIHKGNQKIAVCYWEVLPARIFSVLSQLPGVRNVADKEIRFMNGSVVQFVSQADVTKMKGKPELKWLNLN